MPLASVRGLSWELPPEQWHLHLLGTRFQPEFALGSAYPDFIVFCQFCSPLPPPTLLEIQNDWVCPFTHLLLDRVCSTSPENAFVILK